MADQKYTPISCDYYDELELFALRKTNCEIILQGLENKEATEKIQGVIKNIYARKGEEFFLLEDGTEIRLDRIVSVNGKVRGDNSCQIIR